VTEARAQERGGLLAPFILATAGLALLLGLGIWQVQRLHWKQGQIAMQSERLSAPPVSLPAPERWADLQQERDEFRRVRFPAEFLHDKEALVFTSGSSVRPDVSEPGYWVFTPARLPGGSLVMIDRGFVPDARKNPASRLEGQVSGMVEITGALRWPEQRSVFTPADDPAHNLWFARDPASVASAKNLGAVAPFYVAQEAPAPPGGLPKVGKLVPNLPNSHLQYALTWFGLALMLVCVFGAWLWQRRRGGAAA
jgi:surfeit locus 1 family protein